MQVTVLLFASLRERFGAGRLELDLPPGSTAGDVFDELARRCPAIEPLRAYTTFAINREAGGRGELLAAGDEVALLQPVSGGIGD